MRCLAGAIGLTLLAAAPLAAQPSGGPYGPIQQRYVVPQAAHVYYVAPDGRPDAPGTSLAEPTTLESAIARVVSGDAVILRGGVYRTGGLTLSQGITIQPYADEQPILKGTRVRDGVGSAAEQRLADEMDHPLSRQTARVVAPRARRHAHAAPPVQQRHGVPGRPPAPIGRLGRRARRRVVLHRLRDRVRVHRHRPEGPPGRDHRLRCRAAAHVPAGTRQSQRPQGSGDSRADVHAVRLSRDRYRGCAAGSDRGRRADRRSDRPGRSVHIREGSDGHDLRTRDHLLLLARRRLLPRRRTDRAPLARRRHRNGRAST